MSRTGVIFAVVLAVLAAVAFDRTAACAVEAEAVSGGQGGETATDEAAPEADAQAVDSKDAARDLYFHGMTMINHKKYENAVEDFEKSLKLDPGNYKTLLMLGKVLTRVKRHDDALKVLHEAAERHPTEPQAYDLLTMLYLYLQRPGEALSAAEAAIKNGVDPDTLIDLGWIYFQLGRNDEAEARFKREMELVEEDPSSYRNLGLVWFARGDYEKALEYLQKADELSPGDKVIPYLKALTLRKLGREADAYNEAAQYKKRDRDCMNNIGRYNRLYFPHADPGSINDYLFMVKPDAKGVTEKDEE